MVNKAKRKTLQKTVEQSFHLAYLSLEDLKPKVQVSNDKTVKFGFPEFDYTEEIDRLLESWSDPEWLRKSVQPFKGANKGDVEVLNVTWELDSYVDYGFYEDDPEQVVIKLNIKVKGRYKESQPTANKREEKEALTKKRSEAAKKAVATRKAKEEAKLIAALEKKGYKIEKT